MIVRVAKRPQRYAPMRCYEKRKENLSFCGYASYPEYLASDDWKALRASILTENPKCRICRKPAAQVHHLDYRIPTLLGLWRERLVSLCRECHHGIEFDGSTKRPLHLANDELFRRACAPGPNWRKRRRWFEAVKQAERSRDKQQAKLHRKMYERGELGPPRWERNQQAAPRF